MLSGKTALITGSTSGIGLALGCEMGRLGANVVLNGLGTDTQIEAATTAVLDAGAPEVMFHGANMLEPAEIDDMMTRAEERFGGVDILCNNAGIQHTCPIEDFPRDKWDAIIGINLTALFHCSRGVIPHMRRQNWGRIINTASVHGLVASINKSAYVAAKHGVVGLTKAIALETASTGITCNAFGPGWTETPIIEQQILDRAAKLGGSREEGARDLIREKQPSETFVQVDHLAGLVAFLCSDHASQITGVTIPVDGGWTAQ